MLSFKGASQQIGTFAGWINLFCFEKGLYFLFSMGITTLNLGCGSSLHVSALLYKEPAWFKLVIFLHKKNDYWVNFLMFIENEEEGVAQIFGQHGLRFEVQMSYNTIGEITDFPWLRPSSYLKALVRNNEFHRLLGGYPLEKSEITLKTFWNRYKRQFPSHALFQDPVKSASLQKCIPLYVHGDEGTTYKKKGVLVIGFQSPIGYGSRHAPNQRPESVSEAGIPINLIKTSLQNRFLTAICPKDTKPC